MSIDRSNTERPHVAVIGGGISGLAAAFRIFESNPRLRVTVLEAGNRCGGVIQTENIDGFRVESGPDSLLKALPWGVSLCRRLGLADEMIGTDTQQSRTWILRRGHLRTLPEGLAIMAPRRIWPTVRSPILSLRGKLRMASEWFIRPRSETSDESLAGFARRRFGRETFERLIQPLVSGIYMADPEKLSMLAALPRFVEMEAKHGSLIRAARSAVREQKKCEHRGADSTNSGGMFVTPAAGLGRLVSAIVDRLPTNTVRLQSSVSRLSPKPDGGWNVTVCSGGRSAVEEFDGVIVATPSDTAAQLFGGINDTLQQQLASIAHSGCIIVTLGYSRSDIRHPLNGHGFVVPEIEKSELIACTLSSVKYSGRAPKGQVLLRAYLGGATRPHAMCLNDEEVLQVVARELNPLLGIHGKPRMTRISRWPNVMPQYQVGHLDCIDRIDAEIAKLDGIELAGNSYRGVGIPHCIHSGEQAAERILRFLSPVQNTTLQKQTALAPFEIQS
ncbi:MAG TPA: protoporphyrinogen oxidase [Planctomycetaceae bacterium]|nr:protoporphyrinogen oxidase [Planctomycetaceae bacterium]